MNPTFFRLLIVIGVACSVTGHGALVFGPKHSSQFAYKYEMDVNPSSQDLDGSGEHDWFQGVATDQRIPQSYVGGVAFSNQFPRDGIPQDLFRTDFVGSIQRHSLLGSDFTIEVALTLLGSIEPDDVGGFGIAIDPGGAASAFRLNVAPNGVSLNYGGGDAVSTASNSDAMHIFRIAYNATSDRYWVWRDDQLVYGIDLDTGINPAPKPFNDRGSMFVGDFSATLSGEWAADYIRLDPTASAPIPEPSFAMLGIAAPLLLLRRRRSH